MRPKFQAFLAGVFLAVSTAGSVLAVAGASPVSFSKRSAELAAVDRHVLGRLDNVQLIAAAEGRAAALAAAPYEFAHSTVVDFDLTSSGTWETLEDGSRLWRLRISSPGALHLNLGFSRFDLPADAALWLYDPAGDYVEGPFTARHRSPRGRLYTPIVFGDEIVLELHVPAAAEGPLDVRLARVQHGFRGFEAGFEATKGISGSCNIDVVCPEGDDWRDQIRSVARYSISGLFLCSGQLVNNTAQDDTPYFLSAWHCGVDASNDDTMVIYWNYESPVCGQRGGGSLLMNQTGATFRAREQTSDFLLVELDQMPDPERDVFFTGWDRSGVTPQSSVCIHHPAGDVKAISFNDDPLGMAEWILPNTHWEVDDWEVGTTEQGSSGSCLWDPATHLCVGVLTAGIASCEVIGLDIFGKLSLAWNVGSGPASRLSDWLDPLGLGVMTLPGRNPGDAPPPPPPPPPPAGNCAASETVLCLRNDRFQVEVSRVGGGGPGPARVVPVGSDDSGLFVFFSAENWEMLIKVLDGCAITNHYWVFAASATDVEWTITVTDTLADVEKQYFHPAGSPSSAITDTAAFATCP